MAYGNTDPIVLASQARKMLEGLHKRQDIVVRFKTDESGYAEDATDDLDRKAPGHFQTDKNVLTLNLDTLITKGKKHPDKLDSIEDFRLHPVLAGVAAHESGHARWSRWDELPETIPNPDFDPEDLSTQFRTVTDAEGKTTSEPVPESFPVSGNGKLIELAHSLEEPRIERLGSGTFTKTWRRAMQFSAGHLILENIEEMDNDDLDPLDSAIRMAALVGGRVTAGTLGLTHESRLSVKKILDSAQQIIETAVAEMPEEDQTEDPFHKIMGIINNEIFSNDHENATSHLESARKILKIVQPQNQDDPDANPNGGGGGGGSSAEGEEGEGEEGEAPSGPAAAAMKEMMESMREGVDDFSKEMSEMVRSEEESPEGEKQEHGGHGSTLYKNPRAPQIDHMESPNKADRELYRRALDWMERQIEPTITEWETGQWLPVGGARLNVRSHIRDNMAGHRGTQRSDWDRSSQNVKPAPPVKVAIMLDGSGSMSSMARPSASIAWAAANAAAMLPESRTVSVVYGNAAQVTQEPGHLPARQVAVSKTNGGTEDFIGASMLVEDALWLNDEVEEGEKSNVLIIIVSDLQYGGEYTDPVTRRSEAQQRGFFRITKEWHDKGYQVLVVGCNDRDVKYRADRYAGSDMDYDKVKSNFDLVKPNDLFPRA